MGFFISRKSSRQQTAVPNQRHHIPICESDQRNNKIYTTTIVLHPDARGRHNNIQPERHETCSPQRCKLPERSKSKNSIRQSLLFIQRSNNTTKQRHDSKHRPHNQTRHDIGEGSRTSGTMHHGMRGSIHHDITGRNGTQTSTKPITDRKHDGRCSMKLKDTTRTNKSNGHAIPLAQRQRMPKNI